MTLQERLLPGKYRLRVADYECLAAGGAFGSQKTELIEGDVVVMSPQFRPHGMVKLELYDALRTRLLELDSPLRPVVEFSVAISETSMPDPDIMLTSEPRGPMAVPVGSVALVIEVSDTTLNDDLRGKLRLYANAAIPEYWVADVNGRVIRQFWSPTDGRYGQKRSVAFGEAITSALIDGLTIETGNL